DKLTRAKKLFGAPTILVPLGECQIAAGKIVAGTENLQLVAREVLPSDAPPAFVEAQARARKLLPDAVKKLARLSIVVDAPSNAVLTIADNEESVGAVLLGVEHPADPGKHVITATAPGFLKASQEITLSSGQKERVSLKLEVDPNYHPEPVKPPDDGKGQ